MSDDREMEGMLTGAPAGAAEPLVAVLCVEASACSQETLESAVQAASNSSSSSAEASASGAAALQALRKLPGTPLRVSPHTTVDALRSFLARQEGGAGAQATARDSLASAHFFAVRVPVAADGASRGDCAEEAAEALMPLPLTATLAEVLACGEALQLPAAVCGSDVDTAATPTLVLMYAREKEFGDMIDACIFGFCAAIGGYLAHLCIRKTVDTVNEQKQKRKEKKAEQEMQQQQQQQQQQYYQQQQGPPQQQAPPPLDPSQPPPPPGSNQWYPQGMPPQQQPYYQGPASPVSYGAPPPIPQQQQQQQGQQQQQQQQPANGYLVSQPNNYSYNAAPPAVRTAPAASFSGPSSPMPLHTTQSEPPHALPPPQYPTALNDTYHDLDKTNGSKTKTVPEFDQPSCSGEGHTKKGKSEGGDDFENPSCQPATQRSPEEPPASAEVKAFVAAPQYGPPRASEETPAWSWSPINTNGDGAMWSPASAQADDGTEKDKNS